MSVPATFGAVFVQACRATSKDAATDMFIAYEDTSGLTLAMCGRDDSAFVFSDSGVRFKDPKGAAVSYSWQELDFVLPGDLSLAKDTLDTFTDMEVIAAKAGRTTGYALAVLALLGLGYALLSTVYGIFALPVAWLNDNLGTFGDILAVIGIGAICAMLGPVAIPLLLGTLAGGGIAAGFANWLGRQVRPLVRLCLTMSCGRFQNGILVVHSRWVKPPWGTSTTLLRDFIMIGVKLHRRGLT